MVTKLISCILVASLVWVSSVPAVNAQDWIARHNYSDASSNIILARGEDVKDAVAAAEADAKKDVSRPLWFLIGLSAGPFGVIAAYMVPLYELEIFPSPVSGRLVGKSPEYVAAYTEAYRAATIKRQAGAAWLGCGVSAVLYIIYLLWWGWWWVPL